MRLLSVPGRQPHEALDYAPDHFGLTAKPLGGLVFLAETTFRVEMKVRLTIYSCTQSQEGSALASPLLAQASDLSPRPVGQSQLSADVGKQQGGWTGRLSGPAWCPENLLCHCSSARQAQPTGHFPCSWQDRAVGPSSPASSSADHGGRPPPRRPWKQKSPI